MGSRLAARARWSGFTGSAGQTQLTGESAFSALPWRAIGACRAGLACGTNFTGRACLANLAALPWRAISACEAALAWRPVGACEAGLAALASGSDLALQPGCAGCADRSGRADLALLTGGSDVASGPAGADRAWRACEAALAGSSGRTGDAVLAVLAVEAVHSIAQQCQARIDDLAQLTA
jgi:hypothetical protein